MSKSSRLMVNFKENVRNQLNNFANHNGLTESAATNFIVAQHFNGIKEAKTERKLNFNLLLLYINSFLLLMVVFYFFI